MIRSLFAACALSALATAAVAGAQSYDERPAKLAPRDTHYEYVRRAVDIPMRDGVKLHTVIVIRKGTRDAGILLTRTPYDADEQTKADSGTFAGILAHGDGPWDVIAADGYIRVIQDVRGMHGSQGITLMNPTPAGSPNNPTKTDDSTDTYDTIAWLVKNVPESNGRVGISGISYDGFLPLMALINPHPALKVSVPMNPMVDGWRGDDWFHNGAFRQIGLSYMLGQQGTRDASTPWVTDTADDYDYWLRNVSAGAVAKAQGVDQASGFYRKVAAHPAYDTYWSSAAMDKILAAQPLKVPTMLVAGLWDQEDIYGAPAVYRALEPKDTRNDMVFLTLGPWYHGQEIGDGSNLGAIKWDQDTAKWWRWHVLRPFLAHYLKSDQPAMDVAPVTAFRTGTNEWQRMQAWTQPTPTPLYLKPGGALGFDAAAGAAQTVDYISDPAHPVSYRVRPTKPMYAEGSTWKNWLVDDQRGVSGRPDVVTFTTDVLTQPVTIAGTPEVHLTAATSGTDSDWVVKLVDVYPEEMPKHEEMAGYQLAVAMDIFRGRYREDLAVAKPIAANTPLPYRFALPETNHVFLPGHRIMVQVQSSWFPLYDRNPQTFVPNIFFAQPKDYVTATQKITVSGPDASYIALPVVK
ncbi:CocE/NonD family hydrolase [Sphingomonas sp. CV7422]|uniref:CocE/NonD family hydrolase n=1 Tax=Sphingomonas sp. CV7422 TaxID=3018036 RepID=UPI0022FDC585|nr:CocE/NonD family hydrolase [Sphingomonas sp. CV7422]